MELRIYTTRHVGVFAHYLRPGETDPMNRENNESKPVVRFTDSAGALIREYLAETILGTTPDMGFALDLTGWIVIGPHEMDEVRDWVRHCESDEDRTTAHKAEPGREQLIYAPSTWRGVLPLLVEAASRGSDYAWTALYRLADTADRRIAEGSE